MELFSNPQVGSFLGIGNFAFSGYILASLSKRIHALEARGGSKASSSQALSGSNVGSQRLESSMAPALRDMYQRLEALEDHVQQQDKRMERLEALNNQIIVALGKNGIRTDISSSMRRIPIDVPATNLSQLHIAEALPIPVPTLGTHRSPVCGENADNDDDVRLALARINGHV